MIGPEDSHVQETQDISRVGRPLCKQQFAEGVVNAALGKFDVENQECNSDGKDTITEGLNADRIGVFRVFALGPDPQWRSRTAPSLFWSATERGACLIGNTTAPIAAL